MNAGLLEAGVRRLGLPLGADDLLRLERYLALIQKWNKVYNLTAIRDEKKLVSHHFLDSLAVVPLLPPGSVLDVGSGAGLPGIPIAIASAQRAVTLIDSSHKKTAFLQQVRVELCLANVAVETCRVESYRPDRGFDVVISRAFAELVEFHRAARHLCVPGGRLLAMKGNYPDEELAQLPEGVLAGVEPLAIPGLDVQRHAVFMNPNGGKHEG